MWRRVDAGAVQQLPGLGIYIEEFEAFTVPEVCA
jgi:hypothetical protein